MLPSWSSRVQTTSSPATHPRAAVRESAKFSVVMFCPNATSSAVAFRKPAAVARAAATSASVAREVAKSPPRLAFEPRR